jgi:hypothetical protein
MYAFPYLDTAKINKLKLHKDVNYNF